MVGAVAQQVVRARTRSSSLALERWDCIDERQSLLRVVAVGSGQFNCEGNTPTVADQMALAAGVGPIGRIGARVCPPKTARTEQLSITARDQSIWP